MKVKAFFAMLALSLFGFQSSAAEPVIVLNKRNTLVLRSVVMGQTVATVQQQAGKLSQGLSKNERIYLFLDTPGGSIDAGEQMISTLRGLPQQVDTITNFAASMGFITVQSLGTRYIMPNGILMSHRARGGAQGQIPGELNVRVNFFTQLLDRRDGETAARVGMSKASYQKLIKDEYWVSGSDAVNSKMADKVVLVRCNKELSEGKTVEIINTIFGPVEVTYSDCPLITAPLEINFGKLNLNEYNDQDKEDLIKVRAIIFELVYNKNLFYQNYILTNKYKTILP